MYFLFQIQYENKTQLTREYLKYSLGKEPIANDIELDPDKNAYVLAGSKVSVHLGVKAVV